MYYELFDSELKQLSPLAKGSGTQRETWTLILGSPEALEIIAFRGSPVN